MITKKMKFVLLSTLCLIIFFVIEKRSFYYKEDRSECITIWKRFGGKCLIIPGKYLGLWKPDVEYLETSSTNSLTLIWKNKVTDSLVIYNNYGAPVQLKFRCLKVKYFEYNQRKKFTNSYYLNDKIKSEYESLTIDILENLVVLNGKRK